MNGFLDRFGETVYFPSDWDWGMVGNWADGRKPESFPVALYLNERIRIWWW
jgi:hypothetical protein